MERPGLFSKTTEELEQHLFNVRGDSAVYNHTFDVLQLRYYENLVKENQKLVEKTISIAHGTWTLAIATWGLVIANVILVIVAIKH